MFEKTDVYPYKRLAGKEYNGRARKKGGGFLSIRQIAGLKINPGLLPAVGIAFLLGRAVVLGELFPFIAACSAAAARIYGGAGFFVCAALISGMATITGGIDLISGISVGVMAFFIVQAVPPRHAMRWPVIPILVFGLSLSIKSGFSAFTGASPLQYISIFFESLFAAMLTPACALFFLSAGKVDGIKPLKVQETVSLLVVVAGAVAGTGDIHLWIVSLKGFISRLGIMVAALAGGSGAGAAAGAILGVIPGVSYTVNPSILGMYSFAGMLAGLGRSLGRPGVALSFAAGNIILSIFFNDFAGMEPVIAETSLACLVFFMLPGSLIKGVAAAIPVLGQEEAEGCTEVFRKAVRSRLGEYTAIFREIAAAFESSPASDKKEEEESLKGLLSEVRRKVCEDCSKESLCWGEDYYRIYQNMLDLFSRSDNKRTARLNEIPPDLRVRCARDRELVITASCLYETYKVNRYWQKKVAGGKDVLGEQMRGLAAIIDTLSDELDLRADDETGSAAMLKQKLRQMGFPVREINISRNAGKMEIQVIYKACAGELACRYVVAPAVSELLGQLYSISGCTCEGQQKEGNCSFRLYQGPLYRVIVGASGSGRQGSPVTGDAYAFLQLKNGKFAALLSDGMGTGEAAARESATTIVLLRRMLEAGLEIEVAVKSVNSLLSLRSAGEAFATVDMLVLDLYSGIAQFVKIAAPPSYVLRSGKVRSVNVSSLPVGVFSDMEVKTSEKKMASGDFIIMATDGVLEAHLEPEGNNWITRVLQELDGLEPGEMASLIHKLAQAGEKESGTHTDDMAVVVIKLEKEKVIEIPR